MAKQKIHNGAMIDFLTPAELTDPVNQILAKLGQNAQFKRSIQNSVTDAAGRVEVKLGPRDGFLWSVMSVNCVVAGNPIINIFYNQASAINQIANGIGTTGTPNFFSKSQIVLKGNDVLVITTDGSAGPATANVPVLASVSVIEVPFAHEAQLLL